MFQQGPGEQTVTPSCAGVRCVCVGCSHDVQHCPKFGTCVGIRRAERDCSVLQPSPCIEVEGAVSTAFDKKGMLVVVCA